MMYPRSNKPLGKRGRSEVSWTHRPSLQRPVIRSHFPRLVNSYFVSASSLTPSSPYLHPVYLPISSRESYRKRAPVGPCRVEDVSAGVGRAFCDGWSHQKLGVVRARQLQIISKITPFHRLNATAWPEREEEGGVRSSWLDRTGSRQPASQPKTTKAFNLPLFLLYSLSRI